MFPANSADAGSKCPDEAGPYDWRETLAEAEAAKDPFIERLTDVLIQLRLEEIHSQLQHQEKRAGGGTLEVNLGSAPIANSIFRDLPEKFGEALTLFVRTAYDAVPLATAEPRLASTVIRIAFERPELYAEANARTALVASLKDQPHLQAKLAALTYYTPSKWLLEQEMLSRCPRGEAVGPGPAPGVWPKERGEVYDYAARQSLLGLCFSGGGVRSATFNLGILQALAELDLLRHFDYLSSVSGGGYIHQWFAAWIKRSSDAEHVRKQLIAQPQENCAPSTAEPIRWLRRYASYLTPHRGIFSADLWVVVAVWFRNTLLNQIVLATILGILFALPHLLVGGYEFKAPAHAALLDHDFWLYAGNVIACLLFLWVVIRIANNFNAMRRDTGTEDKPGGLLTESKVRVQLVLPLLIASVWLAFWVQSDSGEQNKLATWVVIAILFSSLNLALSFAGGFPGFLPCSEEAATSGDRERRRTTATVLISLAAVVSAVAATAMVPLVHTGALWVLEQAQQIPAQVGTVVKDTRDWRLSFVLLPPLYLSAPYFGIILLSGFLGADYPEACREWLARFRAWNMLIAGLWIVVTGSALLGPYVGSWLLHTTPRTAIIGFVVAHVTTLVTGSSAKSDGKRSPMNFFGMKPMDFLAWIASPIAIAGLLIAFSSATEKIGMALEQHLDGHMLPASVLATAAILMACLLVQSTLGLRIDVNTFSMHAFYRNRLSRCYLGATNPDRHPDPFTGFDNNGELAAKGGGGKSIKQSRKSLYVRDLLPQNWQRLASYKPCTMDNDKTYDGPFPIFCSTINLTFGQDLAWQERKGASFAFTPLYSGYHVGWTAGRAQERLSFNGYTATDHYTGERGVALDTAAAVSGAAMNPNQGYSTMPAVAFLMTLFNVRLGWWIWNPRYKQAERTWRLFPWVKISRPSPVCAMGSLVKELMTKVDDTSQFVLLTDGGHFENMGLYELVRRRCRYIVICDAEEDPTMTFGGIGRAIRNCRLDFGAEIDLDLRPLQLQKEAPLSQMHCVVGTIKYPPPSSLPPVVEKSAAQVLAEKVDYNGIIVYIKSSLTGDESGDILSYKNTNAVFPQDATANQSFTESQFESYRRLGQHIGLNTFQPAMTGQQYESRTVGTLFENLKQIWYPPTPELQEHFSEHTAHAERLLTELRSEPELQGLAEALFSPPGHGPKHWTAKDKASEAYALQFGNSLIDFMSVVYRNLQLAFLDNRTSPHAYGWITLFQKWCDTALVRRAWEKFGDTYPEEFKMFARSELNICPSDDDDTS